MEAISGKVLIWTDHHFGVKSNSVLRQKTCERVMDEIAEYVGKYGIKTAFFLGDYFHQRNQLSVDTINIAVESLRRLSTKCRVFMIVGNHDLFNKNTVDVSSVNMFRDTPNVTIVDLPLELDVNCFKTILVPWLADLSAYRPESYDFVMGHFDISSKYLMQAYMDSNGGKRRTSASKLADIGVRAADAELGSFIDLAKKSGTVFAGHIHQHKETVARGRDFIFVGSPYQQNMGDYSCDCGFYVVDTTGGREFVKITDMPVHVKYYVSEIVKAGVGRFDFSKVAGNIVQKIYDVDIDAKTDSDINRMISDMGPYEELLPEYAVEVDCSVMSDEDEKFSMDAIRKSKLEYVRNYVDGIDQKALDEKGIDRTKLFGVLRKYYEKAIGEN